MVYVTHHRLSRLMTVLISLEHKSDVMGREHSLDYSREHLIKVNTIQELRTRNIESAWNFRHEAMATKIYSKV